MTVASPPPFRVNVGSFVSRGALLGESEET